MSQWNPDDDDLVDELPAPPRKSIPEADRELLHLAARAIGAVRVDDIEGEQWLILHFADGSAMNGWNPIVHSDDAFELLVWFQMQVDYTGRGHRSTGDVAVACGPNICSVEPKEGDVSAATRRAVVRAAAEIGKQRS